jgi:hypothetical protein
MKKLILSTLILKKKKYKKINLLFFFFLLDHHLLSFYDKNGSSSPSFLSFILYLGSFDFVSLFDGPFGSNRPLLNIL